MSRHTKSVPHGRRKGVDQQSDPEGTVAKLTNDFVGSPGCPVTRTLPRMAKLGWIGSVGLAVGASAGAAAAQFGLGYGLGIISWSPTLSDRPDHTR